MKICTSQKGFTVIEMLLVAALIVGIAGLTMPLVRTFQVSNDIDLASSNLVSTLRRARTLATSGIEDDSWGVNIQTGSIVLFKGSNYASRNTAFDESIAIPSTITPSGSGEIVFDKLTGYPTSTGTVTLTSATNVVRNIAINEKGVIDH